MSNSNKTSTIAGQVTNAHSTSANVLAGATQKQQPVEKGGAGTATNGTLADPNASAALDKHENHTTVVLAPNAPTTPVVASTDVKHTTVAAASVAAGGEMNSQKAGEVASTNASSPQI